MNCKLCGKPVVLVPSAAERVKKDPDGWTAKQYIEHFDTHSACTLRKREEDTIALMRRSRS